MGHESHGYGMGTDLAVIEIGNGQLYGPPPRKRGFECFLECLGAAAGPGLSGRDPCTPLFFAVAFGRKEIQKR